MIRHIAPRRSFPSVAAITAVACLAIAGAACGKKGPPLAPFSKSPAAPKEVSVRRVGERVEIRFTAPNANVDGRTPATIDRVEVWALTGPAVTPELFRKHATLVGSVPVRRPPPPPPDVKEGEPPPPPPPPSTEPGLDQGQPGLIVDELTPDELTPTVVPELEEQRAEEEQERLKLLAQAGPPRLLGPDLGPPLETPPMRYYVVLGRNGGRRGAATQRLPVPVSNPPPAPSQPQVVVAENYVEVTWTEPAGVRRPVHAGTARPSGAAAGTGARGARAAAPAATARPATAPLVPPGDEVRPAPPSTSEPPSPDPDDGVNEDGEAPNASTASGDAPVPEEPSGGNADAAQPAASPMAAPSSATGPQPGTAVTAGAGATEPAVLNSRFLAGFPVTTTSYHVYEVPPPGLTPAPMQPGEVPLLPRRLTTQPTKAASFRESNVQFGAERCFVVRTVETTGTITVESAASPVTCVSPSDTFPPKAPTSLAAVASEGAISLIWDANTEPDLAGYVVLRGQPDGPMTPLTDAPIKETTYRDTAVTPGTRYVYAVVAVDTATPQNVSAQSNTVEEAAR